MCIIIVAKDGTIPREHLEESLRANPHGWGFMVAHKGRLHIRRGLETERFWRCWERRPEGPVVFHARWRSHGTISKRNCHPFSIPQHGHLAVCHNGCIFGVPSHRTMSDTRMFIKTTLQFLPPGFLTMPQWVKLVEMAIGQSKMVFLDGDGNVSILNDHLGHWSRGHWYSNHSYLAKTAATRVTVREKQWEREEEPLFRLDERDRRVPAYYQKLITRS